MSSLSKWQLRWQTFLMRLWAIKNVPLLSYINPTIHEFSDEKLVIKIPLIRRNQNHLGSMYFGVLACGADLAGGFLAFWLIKKNSFKISFVFKNFKAEFLKRPEAETFFICRDNKKIENLVKKASQTLSRVEDTVQIEAICPKSGGQSPVALFDLTLSLKRKV